MEFLKEKHMSESSVSRGGIGFTGILTVVLITLKLVDKIDWSWWWVLAPMWLPPLVILVVMGLALLAVVIAEWFRN